jgi:NADH:ubiquinone oxidoreductase subunit F (NADH-binding)
MGVVSRIVPPEPIESLDAYIDGGGGRGLAVARKLGPAAVIDEVEASGLRGRGGGGFPTGVKWRTVAGFASVEVPSTVVVNGAEGEPGTFKDRTLLRANPYAVVEGALIAALAVGADRAVIALKHTFAVERRRVERAMEECGEAGWCDNVALGVATGPSEYLFGEETALLEVLDGRPPFPRIAPPFRHGVDEIGPRPEQPAGTVMAEPDHFGGPPALANNVETIANVAPLMAEGADWFREIGTPRSPGTIVCTISGATSRHGVAEFALGTSLTEVIDVVGDGARRGRRLVAAMSGVANPLLPAEQFATPLTYEDMNGVGTGLGACGFIVFDDTTDLAAVAAGVSRFLAVESCGQCSPCKRDGLALADLLAKIAATNATRHDLIAVADRANSVAFGARCFLAQQQQRVIEGLLKSFPDALQRHLDPGTPPATPEPIAPIAELGDDDVFVLDTRQLDKQPDWTFDAIDSGKAPVERLRIGGNPITWTVHRESR